MAEPELPRAEREALAAELALGVLAGADRAAALRLRLSDPGFAAEVTAWELRLAGLAEGLPEAAAPDGLLERVLAMIDASPPAREARLLRRLRWWQGGAGGAGLIAAGLALTLLLRPGAPVQVPAPGPSPVVRTEPAIVASLAGAGDAPSFAARYDPRAGALRVRASTVEQGPRVPELWVIPADGVPRSLGLLAGGDTRLAVAPAHRALFAEGAVLAVTMERREGAPHAAPSGAPIATGTISIL